MKRNIVHIILLVLAIILDACSTPVEELTVQVTRCADCPVGRASAAIVGWGDHIYLFFGRNESGIRQRDMWCYDTNSDTWTHLGDTPLKARVRAAAWSTEEGIYVGLGFDGIVYNDTSYCRDWWLYQPTTNTWTRLADFPTFDTNGAIACQSGQRIYLAGASGKMYNSDAYAYDILSDTWEHMPSEGERMESLWGFAGAAWGDGCYIGTGFRRWDLPYWWYYDASTNRWSPRKDIPYTRSSATAVTGNRGIYVFGGRIFHGEHTGGRLLEDALLYLPNEDKWKRIGNLPMGATENMAGYRIKNKVYFGLGEQTDGAMNKQWWYIEE